MKKIAVLGIFLLGLLPCSILAQPLIVSMADVSVQTCDGVLFDTGGQGAVGYQNNENLTLTICPDVPGDVITLVFNNFNLDPTNTLTPPANNQDNITIYDGNSTAAPMMGTYTGNQLQGSIVTCTSGNLTGCLTLVFQSNSVGTGTFSATITCSTPCQPPTALFTSPTVPQNPQKICNGESLTFDASGSTAQAGFVINDYIFDFGDGTIDTLQTPTVTHTFSNGPGEYLVQLYVVDDNGCINMNSEIIKVWISTTPLFNTQVSDSVICLGESSCLDGSFVQPTMYTPSPATSMGGYAYLPDNVGQCFSATLTYSFFTPGQTLTNINDLLGIWVNMEHTFMGDLVATITCPNGTSVILHQQGGGGTNLGDPVQVDDSLQPGTGWNYGWSPQATNGTWVDNSTSGATPNTVTNSTGFQSLAPGLYQSVNPLTPLVGCPLNGVWEIEFCDLWGADDGFVFNWWLDLDTALYPSLTTFTPSIGMQGDSTFWTSSGLASSFITSVSNDSNVICVTPTDTGAFNYTFNAVDDFGCTFDTTITISVVPGPTVDAGNDTTVCIGSTAQLNATALNAAPLPCDYTINMFDDWGDGWNGFEIEVVINGVSIGFFTFNTGSTSSAVFSVMNGDAISINTVSGTFDNEVSYEIVDCNGTVIFSDGLNYTGNNPIIGNNVFNTVGVSPSIQYNYNWTPSASLSDPSISNPVATVNGNTTYIVEIWETGHQLCSTFDTVDVYVSSVAFAGLDSSVTVCPGSAPFDMFSYLGGTPDTNGAWFDNGSPVSNIFDPMTMPPGSYSYTYLIANPTCPDSAVIDVTVLQYGDTACECPLAGYVTTVDIDCFGDCDGQVTMADSTGSALDFSINGLTWTVDSVFQNLCAGNYNVYSRDSTFGPGCIDTVSFVINEPAAPLTTVTTSINNPCFGDNIGSGNVTASGGTAPYTYLWSPVVSTFDSISGLASGTYYVTVTDSLGCTAIDSIVITEPAELIVNISQTDISCNGANDGELIANVIGGSLPYSYAWSHGDVDSIAENLMPGNYVITVTDNNGCSAVNNGTITEPALLVSNISNSINVTCNGGIDGQATVATNGGTTPYTYLWSNGGTNATATNLTAGTYTVATTDNNGCTDLDTIIITEPAIFNITQVTSINESCYGDCDGEITITSPGATQFSINNGASFQASGVFSGLCVGDYDIITANAVGCTSTDSVTITGLPPVIADFEISPQPAFAPETEITFTNQSEGATNYFWNITGFDTANTTHYSYTFPDMAGEYEVCLYIANDSGCVSDICKTVIIKEELNVFIPNAFTPDFNFLNESFKPIFRKHLIEEYTFSIFDRWGELIFTTNNTDKGWDGTYKGKMVPTGIYVYKIKIKDINTKYHHYVGSINLLK